MKKISNYMLCFIQSIDTKSNAKKNHHAVNKIIKKNPDQSFLIS